MPILAVSIDGESPCMRTVQQRTARLIPGVLCDVWADERFQVCLVDRVDPDLVCVRRLPGQSAGPDVTPTTIGSAYSTAKV